LPQEGKYPKKKRTSEEVRRNFAKITALPPCEA